MTRSQATRGLLAAVLIGGLALTGCTASPSETADTPTNNASGTPQEGGTLTVGLDREIGSLDPAAGDITQQPVLIVANALYEPLMKPAAGGTVEPDLAESLTPDATGSTWTLTLPENLAFSDGSPLDADAVKAHIERLADPATGSSSAAQAAQIAIMDAPDAQTLEMTLVAPNADFDAQFARGLGMVTSATLDEFGFPLGAGPFQLESFSAGDSLTVVPNEKYTGSETPLLDEIVFSMMPDTESRMQSLQAGDIDVMWTEVTNQFQQARQDSSLAVYAAPAAVSSIVLNLENEKFADPEVRQALAQAIDREAVNAVVNLGEGTLVDSPYALLGDMAPDTDYPAYDQAAAKKVLEGKNLSFELTVNNRTETIQRATALKDMLSTVGVNVTIAPVDPAAFGAALFAHDFEAADFVTSLFAEASGANLVLLTGSSYNFAGYTNATVDAALKAASATTDATERAKHAEVVADELSTDLPVLWLTASNAGFIASSDVAGFPDLTGITLVSVQPAQLGFAEGTK